MTDADRTPVKVSDYEQLAESLLDGTTWEYVASGAGDEHSLQWNVAAWRDLRLWPHVLVDVSSVDTSLEILQTPLAHPILLAPTAAHHLYHQKAEPATLAGAGAAEALTVMSTLGSTPVAELGAAASGPWWFQLYVQPDRGFTTDLVDRASEAGASAIVLTVDTPLLGARDRDRRHGGRTVPPNLAPVQSQTLDGPLHSRVYNAHHDPSLTWQTLDWLVTHSPVPVLTKGGLRGDDALRAIDCGAAGVIVSNHGARNLDTVVPTAVALPHVVNAVQGQVPVLVDGGIRRGTDVAKALCLGANAVLIGRPAIWGLAVDGAPGVQRVIELLRAELVMAMALLGAPRLDDLTPELLAP